MRAQIWMRSRPPVCSYSRWAVPCQAFEQARQSLAYWYHGARSVTEPARSRSPLVHLDIVTRTEVLALIKASNRHESRQSIGVVSRTGGLFVVWAAVGAGLILGLLTPFTIGLWTAGLSLVIAVVLLMRYRGQIRAMFGLLFGVGAILLFIAYSNRSGPGVVCTSTASGGSKCVQEWSPWLWLIVGLVAVSLSLWLALRHTRQVDDRGT